MDKSKAIEAAVKAIIISLQYRTDGNQVLEKSLLASGFAILPLEATDEMHNAAEREWDGRMSARSTGVWRVMVAAYLNERTANGTQLIA